MGGGRDHGNVDFVSNFDGLCAVDGLWLSVYHEMGGSIANKGLTSLTFQLGSRKEEVTIGQCYSTFLEVEMMKKRMKFGKL